MFMQVLCKFIFSLGHHQWRFCQRSFIQPYGILVKPGNDAIAYLLIGLFLATWQTVLLASILCFPSPVFSFKSKHSNRGDSSKAGNYTPIHRQKKVTAQSQSWTPPPQSAPRDVIVLDFLSLGRTSFPLRIQPPIILYSWYQNV